MNDLEIRTLITTIWRQKLFILRATVVAMILGVLYLHVSKTLYEVNLDLAPVHNVSVAPTSTQALAGAAGINLQQNGDFSIYQSALHSPLAAEAIAERQDLMRLIFASQWSKEKWQKPTGILRWITGAVKAILGFPVEPWHAPNSSDVQAFLSKEVEIIAQRDTAVIVIRMESANPESAKIILLSLYQIVDELLRRQAFQRANAYIDYATTQLQQATIVEYRQALASLLQQQERERMLASANLPFLAYPLGPPLSSAEPTRPHGILTIFFCAALGAFVGLLITFLRARFGILRSFILPPVVAQPVVTLLLKVRGSRPILKGTDKLVHFFNFFRSVRIFEWLLRLPPLNMMFKKYTTKP